MAGRLLENLTVIAQPAEGDLVYVVDDPGGTPLGRKVTIQSLRKALDDEHRVFGTDGDIVQLLRSGSLGANATLANVIVGSPNTPAIPANTLILSNITGSGDVVMVYNRGGNSEAFLHADASGAELRLMGVSNVNVDAGTMRFRDRNGNNGIIWTPAAGTWAFPGATTTMSTVSGDLTVSPAGSVVITTRVTNAQGSDITAADEIALGTDGNYFDIVGATTINHITKTGWVAGSVVILQFDESVTVTHNAGSPTGTEASILLAGAVDFSATADDTLTLVYDGTTFREIARTAI